MLQKAGGTFTLTAEVDFGTTYGLKSAYYKSRTANVSSTGALRLAKTDTVSFRNTANNADLPLAINSSDELTFNGVVLAAASGDVQGPGSSTDGNVVLFNGATGKVIKNSTLDPTTIVLGPGTATDNTLARFDGTSGKLIQSSSGVLSDAGALSGLLSVGATTVNATTVNATTLAATNGPLLAPSGTKMLFYQASAPTGWTRDTSANNKFIRVVSAGSPGTTGGTLAASSDVGSHTHTGPSHSHGTSTLWGALDIDNDYIRTSLITASWSSVYRSNATQASPSGSSRLTGLEIFGTTDAAGTGATGITSLGAGSFAYADLMIATKD